MQEPSVNLTECMSRKHFINANLEGGNIEPLYGYVRTSISSRFFQRNRRLTISRIVLRESFNDPILATERHFHFKKKVTRDFI